MALGVTLCLALPAAAEDRWTITGGETRVTLDPQAVARDVWAEPMGRAATGLYRAPEDLANVSLLIDPQSHFVIARDDDGGIRFEGTILHEGGLAIGGRHDQRWVDTLALHATAGGSVGRFDGYDANDHGPPALTVSASEIEFDPLGGILFLSSQDVTLSPGWAAAVDRRDTTGRPVASLTLRAMLAPLDGEESAEVPTDLQSSDVTAGTGEIGPDIIVGELHNTANYGSLGDIAAFAIGTISCNQGDEIALWTSFTNEHPVIGQNIYRLKDERFEQIGQSWLKHGFAVAAGNTCGFGCENSGSTTLGVGCSDPYGASLNGNQSSLGPRSEVNAYTGFYVYNRPSCSGCNTIERRLQVHSADLDPALNPGAMYFAEGIYVTADDALAGNGENNNSYRALIVSKSTGAGDPGNPCGNMDVGEYCTRFHFSSSTQRRQPGIRAWQDHDATVQETDVRVPGEGLFILAAKAVDRGNGTWEYNYALQNINSDRSAGSFSLPIPRGTIIGDSGFHDVDYHSGEPYDGTDWSVTVNDSMILWSTTQTHAVNPNANALRFGTVYSFWVQTNAPPGETTATIGLFKPGDPSAVAATTLGPGGVGDCQPNEIPDSCDISCEALGCDGLPCGGSEDCNRNGIPDECEPDCNGNEVVDACDISEGTSTDCQPNGIPDDCEEDCDADGVPDDCDPPTDCDNDGIEDCSDYCQCSSPADSCICPSIDTCCFNFGCFAEGTFSREECLASGGTPCCGEQPPCLNPPESPCVGGCTIEEIDGDVDGDGDRDIVDVGTFLSCFSGPGGEPGFVEPSVECRARFDFDDNGAIEHPDYKTLFENYSGPLSPAAP